MASGLLENEQLPYISAHLPVHEFCIALQLGTSPANTYLPSKSNTVPFFILPTTLQSLSCSYPVTRHQHISPVSERFISSNIDCNLPLLHAAYCAGSFVGGLVDEQYAVPDTLYILLKYEAQVLLVGVAPAFPVCAQQLCSSDDQPQEFIALNGLICSS